MAGRASGVLASLLENGDEDHTSEIMRHLVGATHVICIVAFAKVSGWKLIREALADRASNGLQATFVVSLDFYQTEPKVLRGIRLLQSKAAASGGKIDLYVGGGPKRNTLHPKVYWFKGPAGEALIVGSANMTSGGLSTNYELSAQLSGLAAKHQPWLENWIDARIKGKDIVEATEVLIRRYETQRNIYQAAMKNAERQAARSMGGHAGHTITLEALLVEMRADTGPEGFDQSVKRRRQNLRKARAQQAALARTPDLKPNAFLDAYETLISFWHSGGIARGKTTVAKKSARFQAALRALAAEPSDDPAILFDLLQWHFEKVPRAGTNVLTEILHTRDPSRFPVMNQNSVAGIGLANINGYPRVPSKTSVDGARYARFTADAERLRQTLGLADLSELDAVFNFAYWQKEEEEEYDDAS